MADAVAVDGLGAEPQRGGRIHLGDVILQGQGQGRQEANSTQQLRELLVRTKPGSVRKSGAVRKMFSREMPGCSYLEDLADGLIQHLPVHLPAHLGPAQEELLLLEVLGAKAEVCRVGALHPAPETHPLPLYPGPWRWATSGSPRLPP